MRGDPVFPSLGSTIGGVATHSYVVGDAPGASTGSLAGPVTYVAFQQPVPSANQQDEIRTIFVTGFPDNVYERELHNLCRFIPGYEASQVSFKPNQQPQVFVLFASAAYAHQALDALAGLPFDVQQTSSPVANKAPGTPTMAAAASSSAGGGLEPLASKQSDNSGPLPRLGHFLGGGSQGNPGSGPTSLLSAGGSDHAPPANPAPGGPTALRQTSETASSQAPGNTNHNNNNSSVAGLTGNARSQGNNGTGNNTDARSMPALPPIKYTLRCEMAHKNLFVKDGDPAVRRPHRNIVLQTASAQAHAGLASSGALSHLGPRPGQAAAGSSNYVHDVGSLYPAASGGAVPHGLAVHPLMAAAAGGQSQQSLAMQHPPSGLPLGTPLGFLPVTNRGDNPPCNTLFIGNLSDQVSELELLHLLSSQPGYRQMKLVRGPRQVSCFVEFEDTATASAVHNTYQGAVLASSDRGGIRIQFSKNPFGRRSSTPGSNMAALARTANLAPAGDLQSGIGPGNWPVVTYHTSMQMQGVQGAAQMQGGPQAGPGLPGAGGLGYY